MNSNRGFTLIEIVVVIFILTILASILIADFLILQKKSELDNSLQEFAGILKLAQNKTLASENNSQYGVYLDTSVSPNKYVLFKGTSFATRDNSADQSYWVPKTAEFYQISLGGGSEIVFNRLTGASEQSGSVSLRLKSDTSQIKTVYISSAGTISFNSLTSPSDSNRVKDSRHVHFDYSRAINTASENITLNFNNNDIIQTFPISSYLVAGQLNLKTTVTVSGTSQTVEVHTHRLNSPDTQFSVHRDRRLNDKSLKITISGDSSGYIANYSANGLTTDYSSIYISNFVWQ